MMGEELYDCGTPTKITNKVCMLGNIDSSLLMSVYCACGNIVNLDRSEMMLKLSLGKDLQCTSCRNKRISSELDAFFDESCEETAEIF